MAPRRRIDLSLPSDVPLGYMLPTLLRAAGPDLANLGLTHSGWVLQRLDEAPLDESKTLTDLGVRDGELLYLRPVTAQLPEVVFDDVADVVATGINEHADRWKPDHTRRFGLTATAVALVAGALALAASGPAWGVQAALAGGIALVLLLAGVVTSRAIGDARAGALLGYCSLPYAFLGGLLAPAGPVPLGRLGAPHLLAAFAAVAPAAVVAGFGIVGGLPLYLGIAFVALLETIAAALVMGAGLSPQGAAAFIASTCLVVTALIPSLAVRLGRLPLPPPPENAEELRSAAQTFDGRTLLERTREADRFATGLVAGVALACLAAQLALVPARGWAAAVTGLIISLVLLLRARVFHGRAQRLWMLGTGLAGLLLQAVRVALTQSSTPALVLLTVLWLNGVVVMATMAIRLPARKPSPFWGRAADILDMVLIMCLFPFAMGLLNLYSWLRGLAG